MSKLVHLCMNIKGCLANNSNKQLKGMFQDDDGADVHPELARKYLNQCLAKGWKVIPVGDCDDFDYQTGCNGHIQEDSE